MNDVWRIDLERANACRDRGDSAAAIAILSAAIEREPENGVLWLHLGDLQEELNDLQGAEVSAREAIKYSDQPGFAYLLYGQVLIARGRTEEAIEAFRQSAAVMPRASAFVFLGDAYCATEDLVEAEAAFQEALRLDPTCEEAFYNLALIRSEHKCYMEAIEFLRQAIALDPNYGIAHCKLGQCLLHTNDLRGAEAHLLRAIELLAVDPWCHLYLGKLREMEGRLGEAAEQFRKAREIDSTLETPLWLLGDALARMGRHIEAEQNFRLALELAPEDPTSLYFYSKFLWRQERDDEAKAYARKALTLNPDDGKLRRLWQDLQEGE